MVRAKRHTIIGNSAAGLAAVKAIRKAGDEGPIVLISAENCPAYSPVLTTYYLAGDIGRSGLFLVNEDFYRQMKVRTLFGRRAVEIDPSRRLVRLDNRTKAPFDDLLIATGASARTIAEVEAGAREKVATLRTLADAERIKKASEKARDIVVTGAGLVSLQAIKAILGRGPKITAVVGSYQVLSQQMDAEAAGLVQRKLEARGVNLLFGREVKNISRRGDRVQVKTNYHELLPADLVIVGKGVRPNVLLAEQAGIEVGHGIVVDERMRTSREDIYAAGDVAEGLNSLSGRREVIATWLNACAQGEVAGFNMAGLEAVRRDQFRENVTNILGVVAAAIGLSHPEGDDFEEVRHLDEERGVCRKLYFQGPTLVGALLLNRVEDAGLIRNCIANRSDLSAWKEQIARAPLHFGHILGASGGGRPYDH
ncbi:MAG: FAD-dependent oxidoreductase [Thermodesulfobacteriota bacterium]